MCFANCGEAQGTALHRPIYYGYYMVGAAFVAQFVAIGIYSYVLGAFMEPMLAELGWSRADFTLTRTIGQGVMAVVGLYVGVRVDRLGGRPIMLVGATILVAGLCLHTWIQSLWMWWLLNGVVVTAGCAMIGNLVVNVTLSKWFVVNRGIVVAIAAMGVSFGGIVLTPLATYLVDTIGWRQALGGFGCWIWSAAIPCCADDASRSRRFWLAPRRTQWPASSGGGR
jgi:MFS family permease